MNLTSPVIAITLLWCLQAQATPLQPSASNSNPYNSPIQRANPNSRQGSVPAAPPVRGPSTVPTYRTPSLDNRGIGNGDNLRRQQQVPNLEPSRPPRENPRAP